MIYQERVHLGADGRDVLQVQVIRGWDAAELLLSGNEPLLQVSRLTLVDLPLVNYSLQPGEIKHAIYVTINQNYRKT